MKKILGIFVFLTAIALSLPAIDGYIFKKSFDGLLSELMQDPHLQVTVIDYRMGWFHSTAKLELGLTGIPNVDKTPTFTLDADITHGPLIFNRKTKSFVVAEAFMENLIAYPLALQLFLDSKSRYLASSDTTFFFGGRMLNHGVVSPIKSHIPDTASITWDGIKFDYEVIPKGRTNQELVSHVTFGAISIQSMNPDYPMNMSMQPMQIDSKGLVDANQVWLGNSYLDLPNLSFTNMEGKTTQINQFKIDLHTAINSSLYNLKYAVQLGKLDIPWNTQVPSIAPATISMSINNLHPQYLMTFLQKVNDMRDDRSRFRDEKQTQPLIDMLVQKILTPTSELLFDGNIQSPTGLMEWNSKVNNVITIQNGKKLDCDIHMTGRITEKLALILADLYLQGEMKNHAPDDSAPSAPTEPTMNMFNEKVAALMKDGKMSLAVAMQVMDTKAKNLPADQFASEIKSYDMSDSVRSDINKWYAATISSTPAMPAAPAAATTMNTPQHLIDGWVSDGYLVREGEFLKLNLVREKGVMTLGTKVIQ